MAPDGRMYNSTGRKGELHELRTALNSNEPKERKRAVKRVVAAMTLGRDLSSLFPDVIKNAMTENLAMKKLCYLYIINYARANESLLILVINTFVKDASAPNPLIRALSIRTMALIPALSDYIVGPLHAALVDKDPYVRKTAAVCVAKLHDTNARLVRSEGFIPKLQKLLSDPNPMTVANAVGAVAEIADASSQPSLLQLDARSVPRFLAALGECTEWGQIFVLDAIAGYRPPGGEVEARAMVERIIPRMQHANSAVVLAAVRVVIGLIADLGPEERDFLVKKMRAPLISLLSTPPEMQFVALRNMHLLQRQVPDLFDGHSKVFYVAYNDPLYVKVEKLDMLVRLTNAANARHILAELKEYANEVDVQFVRRAIGALGNIAVRVSSAAPAAIQVLTDLLASGRAGANTADEVAIVLADVLRAHPGEYTSSIAALVEVSESISDPSARAALVWIVGEHAAEIEAAGPMVGVFVETMEEEALQVQLHILTAAVKLFLIRGRDEDWELVQKVVGYATNETDCADLRERGILYARMLGASVEGTRAVLLSKKPCLTDIVGEVEPKLLKELLGALGSVAAVYRQPVSCFRGVLERSSGPDVGSGMVGEEDLLGLDDSAVAADETSSVPAITAGPAADGGGLFDIDDFLGSGGGGPSAQSSKAVVPSQNDGGILDDILGPSAQSSKTAVPSQNDGGILDDILGFGSAPSPSSVPSAPPVTQSALTGKVLLPIEKGKGLVVRGGICRQSDGSIALDLELDNKGSAAMSSFAIQLKRNAFGLIPAASMSVPNAIQPGGTAHTIIPLGMSPGADAEGGVRLHMAFKFLFAGASAPVVVYCSEHVVETLDAVLEAEQGRMDKPVYLKTWASTPDAQEVSVSLSPTGACDLMDHVAITRRLESGRIFLVAKRSSGGSTILYMSALVVGPLHCQIMAELTLPTSAGGVAQLASRSPIGAVATPFLQALGETCQKLLT